MNQEKQIVLSARLGLIAQLIPEGSRVADIGTDHGYLPIWLVQNQRSAFVVACDVRQGPLNHAKRSAEQWSVEQQIDFRLGDGLRCISQNEVDTIVIAGMGGETIASILEAAPWTKSPDVRLILQPMTKAELLRPWLAENGYQFVSEHLVWENKAYFPVIQVCGSAEPYVLTLGQRWGGVLLDHDPLQMESLNDSIRKHRFALAGLEKSDLVENAEKAKQQRCVISALEKMKEACCNADSR